MNELKLYKSNWKGIKLLALTLPFVVIGLFMINKEQYGTFDFYMGWVITFLFGLGILIAIFTIVDKRVQIIISETGVFDRTLKQELIKWEQINKVYPIAINHQKFISLVVNDNFKFKKKQFQWAIQINQFIGAQQFNLNLSQIDIDATNLSELLNKIIKSEKNERLGIIKTYISNKKIEPNKDYQSLPKYFFILTVAIGLSLIHLYFFIGIVSLMGVAALIAKWYYGTNHQSKLYRYSKIITILGFFYLLLLFTIFIIYEKTSNTIGVHISTEIENYKSKFGLYPTQVDSIYENLNLNFFQNYIAKKIEYKKEGDDYVLELQFLYYNKKQFDPDQKEWF